jgi:predicted nuclease of predicted toxin-antitoxin system
MGLRVLLDECLPPRLIGFLESLGLEAEHVALLGRSGISNGEVHDLAVKSGGLLITADRHFRHPLRYPATRDLGVIFLRVTPPDLVTLTEALRRLFSSEVPETLVGKKVIVRRDGHEILR